MLCQGFSRLQKLGLCVGKGTVNKKLQEASCEFDSKVKAWMAAIEKKKARGFALIFYRWLVWLAFAGFLLLELLILIFIWTIKPFTSSSGQWESWKMLNFMQSEITEQPITG